jgi:PKHD-type hydroxylase
MNLQNYYWYYPKAIPAHLCDEIIKYGLQIKEQMALTGGYGSNKPLNTAQIKNLKQKRDSNIVWIAENWIYKEIHPYIRQANINAGWNYEWTSSESCQFTKYNKGQYYDWHSDGWYVPYNQPNTSIHGKIRKLSVTVSLSDEKDYKGGELEFDFRNMDPEKKRNTTVCKQIRPKGSMVIFPSFVWHRVTPVTKGSRYSLVIWNLGWPFK